MAWSNHSSRVPASAKAAVYQNLHKNLQKPVSEVKQCTNTVLMIEPVHFYLNPETAKDNEFQNQSTSISNAHYLALNEFKALQAALKNSGVKVCNYVDLIEQETPDSIFPNNWFSTHNDTLVIYPISKGRRKERRQDIIFDLFPDYRRIINLSYFEEQDKFLEGTGSLVLDRVNSIAYAALSERTHPEPLAEFCHELGFEAFGFNAFGSANTPVYHTNVLLSIGSSFAVVCFDAIPEKREKELLEAKLATSGKDIIAITKEQMNCFCANVLELHSVEGDPIVAMSSTAFNAFTKDQLEILTRKGLNIVHSPIPTIETLGGGSVRCMIAERF